MRPSSATRARRQMKSSLPTGSVSRPRTSKCNRTRRSTRNSPSAQRRRWKPDLLRRRDARQQRDQAETQRRKTHQNPFFGCSHETERTPADPARHQLCAQVVERQVGIDQRVIGDGGFLALRNFACLEDDAVAREDALHVIGGEVAPLGDHFDRERAAAPHAGAVEDIQEDAEERRRRDRRSRRRRGRRPCPATSAGR